MILSTDDNCHVDMPKSSVKANHVISMSNQVKNTITFTIADLRQLLESCFESEDSKAEIIEFYGELAARLGISLPIVLEKFADMSLRLKEIENSFEEYSVKLKRLKIDGKEEESKKLSFQFVIDFLNLFTTWIKEFWIYFRPNGKSGIIEFARIMDEELAPTECEVNSEISGLVFEYNKAIFSSIDFILDLAENDPDIVTEADDWDDPVTSEEFFDSVANQIMNQSEKVIPYTKEMLAEDKKLVSWAG